MVKKETIVVNRKDIEKGPDFRSHEIENKCVWRAHLITQAVQMVAVLIFLYLYLLVIPEDETLLNEKRIIWRVVVFIIFLVVPGHVLIMAFLDRAFKLSSLILFIGLSLIEWIAIIVTGVMIKFKMFETVED